MSRPERQDGVALITVLWALVILAVMVTSMTGSVRRESQALFHAEAAVRTAEAARGAANLVIHSLLEENRDAWAHPADSQWRAFDFGGGRAWITVRPLRSLVDLNYADGTFIEGLLVAVGAGSDRAAMLSDSILDWRDTSDARRALGATDAEYQALGRRYGRRNGDFETIDELQMVYGMTPEIWQRLAPWITVHGEAAVPDPAAAGAPVLAAFPGHDVESVRQWAEQRDYQVAQGGSPPAFPGGSGSGGQANRFRIDVLLDREVSRARVSVTVEIHSGSDPAFRVLAWRDPAEPWPDEPGRGGT